VPVGRVTTKPASEVSTDPPRQRKRWIVAGTLGLLLILALAVALSWHFSSVLLVPDHSPYSKKVDIEAVSPNRITFPRSEASERPGYYGLAWQAGHAIVGPIESHGSDTVVRKLTDVEGHLVPGTKAGFETNVYAGNPRQARGLPFRTVDVPDPLGPMQAWLIPAARARDGHSRVSHAWAIVVHGHNDDRENGLRIAPALRRAGRTTLLISYRSDPDAPDSPDDRYHLGETEWQDLRAAARYALRQGARHLVLAGYSMGGAVIEQFMQRSPLANRVSGVILDAPTLNWKSIIGFNAEQMGLPSGLRPARCVDNRRPHKPQLEQSERAATPRGLPNASLAFPRH
jgi:alpha/beta superfamily hydrolase